MQLRILVAITQMHKHQQRHSSQHRMPLDRKSLTKKFHFKTGGNYFDET